jgi:chromosome segregation ATPase
MSRTVRLREYCDYIGQQCRSMRQVYAEIEEVQYQFNEVYRQTMEAWQAAIARTAPLLSDPEQLPPSLAHSLLTITNEERAKLEQEIADITAKVAELRSDADGAATEAQAELASLRQTNPQLDAQEEELKARIASIRQTIQQLDVQIKRTNLLTGVLQRRRLGKQREAQRQALTDATAALRRVRQSWEDEKKRYQADQVRLREKWEAASIEAAQSQARLDHLQANLEALSRQNGAGRYLAELEAAPEAPEPLHKALEEMVELNGVKKAYEEGLRAVAEALGLLKGLAEGMDRFQKSADKVLEEQQQYNLRELKVLVTDEVASFHAVWPEFRAQVRDEKALGKHPLEFSQRVRGIINSRLGDAAIAAMFESMGAALTEATKAWG